jgi:hypothetical protein
MLQQFNKLDKRDKIDFFIKTQTILIEFHPDSPFIINKENLKTRLEYASDMFGRYCGWCFTDKYCSILFNYIKIDNVDRPLDALKKYQFTSGAIDYNAIVVDFAAFREIKDCLDFCRTIFNSNIKWVVWVHKEKPSIYPALEYMTRILNIPKV